MTRSLRVGALLCCLVACSSPQKKKADHFEKGEALYAQGNYDGAILELKNVLQIDPRDSLARYKLALALLEKADTDSLQDALYHLSLSTDHDPSNLDAKLKLAELQLRFGQNERALEQAKGALKLAAGHAQALLLRGQALLAIGDLERALEALDEAVKVAPQAAPPLIALGQAQLLSEEYGPARQSLEKALGLDPKSFRAYLALGDLHSLELRDRDAEAAYRRALELADHDTGAYLKLGGFYRRTRAWTEAEAVYKQFAQAKPSDPEPLIALGHLHRQLGKSEEAVGAFKAALKLDPKSVVAEDQLLNAHLGSGNVEALRAEIQRLAAEGADNPLVTFYQAKLEIQQKNYDEGIKLARALIQREPNAGAAHMELGRALLASGDTVGAITALEKAATIGITAVEANAIISELHLAEGAVTQALQAGKRAYERNNRSLDAVAAYGNALVRAQDFKTATTVFEKAAEQNPKVASLQYHLGQLALVRQDPERAKGYFEQALKLEPSYAAALEALVALYANDNQLPWAIERVQQQLQLAPKQVELYNLFGQLYEAQKQPGKAEEIYKQAMSLQPVTSDTYGRLATLYIRTKQGDKIKKDLAALIAQEPNNLGAHVVLAMLSHVSGEQDIAKQHYELAFTQNPMEGISANNLANILLEDPEQLNRALEFGEAAYRARPGNPDVIDTLGWIYYKKKDYPRAVRLLRAAAERSPRHPVILFHYGAALAETEDSKDEARRVFERLSQLSPDMVKQKDVQAVMAKIAN